ncbi:hypothetical protein FQN60_004510, partial [Etheostoma spectabile]
MRKDWSWQFAGTNQLAPKHDITFFCMDVACKYWPYLQRVCLDCPELQSLQNMRPFCRFCMLKPMT